MMRDRLRRPAGDQPLLIAGLTLVCIVAVVATLILTGAHDPSRHRTLAVTAPAAPAAVVGTKPAPPALTSAQLAQARTVARAFLASYLPVLYGRTPARTLVDVTAHVRAELEAAARTPRAPKSRKPRVASLTTKVQSASRILAIAMIADSVDKPYQVVFQLTKTRRDWEVSELANY